MISVEGEKKSLVLFYFFLPVKHYCRSFSAALAFCAESREEY